MSKEILHIIDRIKHIKDLQSKTAVAEVLGMSKENLNGYIKRNKIPLQAILLFCEKENISPTYVLYGHSRGELKFGYGPSASVEYEAQETPSLNEAPPVYTSTAEKHADVFAQVRDILESGDDFVIKALRERLNDYRISVAMNRERRGINQRLARVEELLEKIAKGETQLGEVPPVGVEASPANDTAEGGSDTEEKAI